MVGYGRLFTRMNAYRSKRYTIVWRTRTTILVCTHFIIGAGLRAMYIMMTTTKKYLFNIETVLLNREKLVGLGRHVPCEAGGKGEETTTKRIE